MLMPNGSRNIRIKNFGNFQIHPLGAAFGQKSIVNEKRFFIFHIAPIRDLFA